MKPPVEFGRIHATYRNVAGDEAWIVERNDRVGDRERFAAMFANEPTRFDSNPVRLATTLRRRGFVRQTGSHTRQSPRTGRWMFS